MGIIETSNLTKYYGKTLGIKDVSIDVKEIVVGIAGRFIF